MEKFGIFNVLSSLLGNSGAEKSEKTPDFSVSSPQGLSEKTESGNAEKRATFAPLQNSMLSTMKNHEEFVKRVRAKNGNGKTLPR